MMKQILTLLIFLSSFALTSFAQVSSGSVKGRVEDNHQHFLEAATVALLRAADSSAVKMVASDKDGRFTIENIQAGKYLVAVTAVGLTKNITSPFELNAAKKAIVLNTISLQPQSKDLSAVTVVGRKSLIEQKVDRTVLNVDAAVSNVGASALDVLEKSPGVTVDKDGNISLKGKQGVMVMLDGKPSYLSGAELVNLLRNMNANQLDQIEIMTNPPAKYDAAGNSGIINIKTKKNKQQGFNGSLSTGYSQGKYWKTNNSVNLNYKNGRFNTFLNMSYNKNNSFQQLDILRKYKNEDGKLINAIFEQSSYMKRVNENSNIKAGVDFFVNNKTTLGLVATGFISPENIKGTNTSYLKNAASQVDSIVYATSNNKGRWTNGTLNLNFRHQFDSTGKELTADVDYVRYSSTSSQDFINSSFRPDWTKKNETALNADLPIGINIYSAKVDYTQTIAYKIKFDAGIKSSYVNTDNVANYFSLAEGQWVPDYGKTNRFQYTENINAAYVNFNKQIKKFGVQAGFRFENTNYKGQQKGNPQKNDSSFSRTYNNLFPTIYLSYAADKENQFGMNIGRRIDRPAYQDLNPFLFFLDNYTYSSGNPYLKPQYSTNIEFSHTFKSFLTTTLNYSETKNFFMETFEQSDYATIVRKGNIGVKNNAGIAVSAQVPVNKWWTAVLYGNYNYTKFSGELYGEQLKVEASNVLFNVNNQLKFKNGWGAELSGFYRTKGVEGQILIMPLGQVAAGVSKQVLKNKGSIRFNVRDLFYTQKVEGFINFQKTEAHFWNKRDSRVANITFTYRFGKPLKNVQGNRKTGGSSDEQSRVNVGNN